MLYLITKSMKISKKYIPTKLQQMHNKILFVATVLQHHYCLLCFCCICNFLIYKLLIPVCNKTTK